ncbi:MAG: alpha/beta hydrolase [Proteobacteria bacterium]|nr:MAG: alpha/beta hydrolase [Pseudomonadota bacterium]
MTRSRPARIRAASTSRRTVLAALSVAGLHAVSAMPAHARDEAGTANGVGTMATFRTGDGTEIFYKDWGPKAAQPIVFHHGWPLSADDWDNQMMFFLSHGYRVIAHDRRGHGRSAQTDGGGDMDTYAGDMVALADALDLRNAVHIGHSAGGGEVARYVARAKPGRVARMVLISAVTPLMIHSESNAGGLPKEVFDGFRASLVANRAQFYRDIPAGPFFGFNRAGAKASEPIVQNWWRQAMMGSIKGQYDCIKAMSETDFTQDLKSIGQPTLILHAGDDQIVPVANSSVAVKLVRDASLKVYPGLPHGMCTTHPDIVNPDLLAFVKG